MKEKKNKGITLIALVITIIVLLILAGVTLSTLFGNNGILTESQLAVETNKEANAREQVQLAWTACETEYEADYVKGKSEEKNTYFEVEDLNRNLGIGTVDDVTYVENGESTVLYTLDRTQYTFKIVNGQVYKVGLATSNPSIEKDPENEEKETTGVKIPEGNILEDENITKEEGIVIKDANNNEFVWISVPKDSVNVYKTAGINITDFTDEEYKKIETDLKEYSEAYNNGSGQDEWYAWKNGIVTHETQNEEDKKLDNGCGLNYFEYYELKKKMLKSIYENQGFWIGRYEAGIEGRIATDTNEAELIATPRVSKSDSIENIRTVSQPNKYPYNYVTCSQAQSLASKIPTTGGLTSSLMFGVQWNLVCQFIATKLGERAVNSDSWSWGNYAGDWEIPGPEFKIDRGEYSENGGSTWLSCIPKAYKDGGDTMLLTTGASERNKILNIYDFAGNEGEFTLEYSGNIYNPCVYRGGYYPYESRGEPACGSGSCGYDFGCDYYSFRVTLY